MQRIWGFHQWGVDGFMRICQVSHKTIKRICLISVCVCIVISLLAICRQKGRNSINNSINISFPKYTEDQLYELQNGHHTGYFDKEDVLFTFLGKYNDGDFGNNPHLQYEDYSNITEKASVKDDDLNDAVFDIPCEGGTVLTVYMRRISIEEIKGLWQVYKYEF